MTTYLSGLMLGFRAHRPIGPQNIVVLNQGLTVRFPRSLFAAAFAGLCDTLLIIIRAVGVGALLAGIPALRSALLAVGTVFLLFLAWGAVRRSTTDMPAVDDGGALPQVAMKIAGASLLNPHAILDTVVIIVATIAAQRDDMRLLFAGGTLSASWLWFAFLVLAAGAIRRFLTPNSRPGWIKCPVRSSFSSWEYSPWSLRTPYERAPAMMILLDCQTAGRTSDKSLSRRSTEGV